MDTCCRCECVLDSEEGYAVLLHPKTRYGTYTELEEDFFRGAHDRAVAASVTLCLKCLSETSEGQSIDVGGNWLLPTYLGNAVARGWQIAKGKTSRNSEGNEHCINCYNVASEFSFAVFNDGVSVYDWFWICPTCVNTWWMTPEKLSGYRPPYRVPLRPIRSVMRWFSDTFSSGKRSHRASPLLHCKFCNKQVHIDAGAMVSSIKDVQQQIKEMGSRQCECSKCGTVYCLECGTNAGKQFNTGTQHCPGCGQQRVSP